jgi:phosphate transport system permease protein
MNNTKERIMKYVFAVSAFASVGLVALICIFLFSEGIPAIKQIGFANFIFGTKWDPMNNVYGIMPMITGSLCVTAGALIFGVPAGVLTAIFLSHFCPKGLYSVIRPMTDLLAGVPSVVYGFFGLMVAVPFIRNVFGGAGTSMLAAAFVLGIMILPTVCEVSESSLRAVPDTVFQGALALGASKERAVFKTVVPAARSGISAGIVLGFGRAVGETMAVVMIEGNQAVMPSGLTSGVRTLTADIVLEMGYAADLHRQALIAVGCVLFVFILIINMTFSVIRHRRTV